VFSANLHLHVSPLNDNLTVSGFAFRICGDQYVETASYVVRQIFDQRGGEIQTV